MADFRAYRPGLALGPFLCRIGLRDWSEGSKLVGGPTMGQLHDLFYSHFGPAGVSARRGFLVPPNGLRGSHCGAAFEALSCGRDRVRWPVPLAGLNMAGWR